MIKKRTAIFITIIINNMGLFKKIQIKENFKQYKIIKLQIILILKMMMIVMKENKNTNI